MKLKPWLVALAVAAVAVVVVLAATRTTIRQAAESYVYGYPLVLMEVTQRAFTATRAAPNTLFNVPVFPDSDFREVVRPNVDTLYSIAWLDLADGPRVFEVPATDRYYVMQFLDGWTNVFASIGPRTTGRGPGVFLIAGPGWDGAVPDGATLLRSPTRIAWLLGRIQTNGVADYGFVHDLQSRLRLRSLEDFLAGEMPAPTAWQRAVAASEPPLFQMRSMDAVTYFGALARLLADNPPAASDGPALEKLASVGVHPGRPVEAWGWLERRAITLGMWIAARRMQRAAESPRELQAGWSVPPMNIGAYGTEYGLRAVVAMAGLGAKLPAVTRSGTGTRSPSTRTDPSTSTFRRSRPNRTVAITGCRFLRKERSGSRPGSTGRRRISCKVTGECRQSRRFLADSDLRTKRRAQSEKMDLGPPVG